MTRIALALVGLLLAVGCPAAKPEDTTPAKPATPKEVVAAVRGVIEQWRQGYEVRSLDALAKLYTQDADSVVVQDGQPLIGWSSVEAMLKDRIARAKTIHVRLKDVQVTALGPDAAFAIATMTRELSDGVTTVVEQGALTLTLRKDPAGWRIVAEHYSFRRNG